MNRRKLQLCSIVVAALVGLSVSTAFGQAPPPKKSPIDITNASLQVVPNILARNDFTYPAVDATVYDPGHNHAGVQLKKPLADPDTTPFAATTLAHGGKNYALHQLHFHGPSEHKLNGTPFDMELHLVHREIGNLSNVLVVGRWMTKASANPDHPELNKIFGAALPAGPQPADPFPAFDINAFDLGTLLPAAGSMQSYKYSGSLTAIGDMGIPVEWRFLANPLQISVAQHDRFRAYLTRIGLPNGNASNTQDLAGRTVQTDVPEPAAILLAPAMVGLITLRRHAAARSDETGHGGSFGLECLVRCRGGWLGPQKVGTVKGGIHVASTLSLAPATPHEGMR